MAALSVFGHLKGLFYDGVVIDDPVFKLHYGFTTYLLLFMTFLTVGKVFLSDPIYCSLQMYEWDKIIPKDMLNNYCYINSTFIVPNGQSNEFADSKYSKDYGIGAISPSGEAVYHSYYQWISLMLFVQGMFYYVSHLWWAQMENGTLKHLKMNLDNPSLDPVKEKEQLAILANYFYKNEGRHHLYGLHYFYVVIFNALHVCVDIVVTHYMLSRHFLHYGFHYAFSSPEYRLLIQSHLFPKMSKCSLYIYGPSGTKQVYDALCVLPLNILNEKIFLLLWFWYLILLLLSLASVLYWTAHIVSPKLRLNHIEKHLKGTVKGNHLKFLNKHFGDWFLLHQLYKNIHLTNFTQLVSQLCNDQQRKEPKSNPLLKKSETFISFNLSKEAGDGEHSD